MQVLKRDGTIEQFNKEKIYKAILGAMNDIGVVGKEDVAHRIANDIERKLSEENADNIDIEHIQDLIETKLMQSSLKDVAKQFIKYRYDRERIRQDKSTLMKHIKEKLFATNVENQNANLDERSFSGRMNEANRVVMKDYALYNCMSEMSRNNHLNNYIYIHDLDSYAAGMHNCLSIPFDDLLAKGFGTRQCDVRPAGSVNTAFQLVAVIFQLQSLQQFGGVSATHLDWTMVPYVRKSFLKHFRDGIKYIEQLGTQGEVAVDEMFVDDSWSIEDERFKEFKNAYRYAFDMTEKETSQAVEGMYHNLNTLQSRSGQQLPFTSINYGTCTLPEGRMVIKALLENSIKGVGKLHKTPIFPCGIFQYMKGVNDRPGTPNYDLKMLALESTSKRFYPNYANVDWSGNAGYDINDPRTYFSTMGALDGKEHLYVRVDDGIPQDISIKELFELCQNDEIIAGRPSQITYSKPSLSLPGKTKKVQDHSKATCNKGAGVYRITYLPEDVSYIGSSSNMQQRWNEHRVAIRTTGGPDCGIKFGDPQLDNYLFEVIEYTDDYKEAEEKYILKEPNINIRGISKKFYKSVSRKYEPLYEKPVFNYDLTVPQILINLEDKNIKVLDRDNNWTKVLHIFKNDKKNTPQMMHIKYEENGVTRELSCTEDHPLWNGETFVRADHLNVGDILYRADGLQLPIIQISWHWEAIDSYDIGTATGTFIGSDVIMHNCRTANGWDVNGLGQLKDGRGNICPVTILMPFLAMEAKEEFVNEYDDDIVELFMQKLDNKINEAKDMLLERFEWICAQDPSSANFMWDNNTMAGYVPEEGIRSALKHGTIVIGQLGLAETLQILIGCDHTTKKGMELAKRIEQLFKDRCALFKEKYKLNFGVYYTPAENLCYTAMKNFKKKYGEIKNVSDKDFFTNSMHVPVWKQIDPFEKIDIESQLTGYSSAGCITYVELESSCKDNIEALEVLVDYAMDKDIPYFAINIPSDICNECGYTGEFNDECPVCGSTNIQQLRRVTGYLTTDWHNFNYGKQREVQNRVKHTEIIR